jgi:hypothetical protein
MTADELEAEQGRLIDNIQSRVQANIQGDCFVQYSAYDEDANGLPVDNLDQIAVKGKV